MSIHIRKRSQSSFESRVVTSNSDEIVGNPRLTTSSLNSSSFMPQENQNMNLSLSGNSLTAGRSGQRLNDEDDLFMIVVIMLSFFMSLVMPYLLITSSKLLYDGPMLIFMMIVLLLGPLTQLTTTDIRFFLCSINQMATSLRSCGTV